jgi:hypothetical protein
MGVAQRLWRVLDAVDYWVMQARLWRVDALYGPKPETEADRQRGVRSGAPAALGSPPAAGVVRLFAKPRSPSGKRPRRATIWPCSATNSTS